jgi:hypothetical protein
MLRDLKITAMHLSCVCCLVAKLILTPFVKLAGWVQLKIDSEPK